MQEVMNQAQKLAEAILNSDVFQQMHQTEQEAMKDQEATAAIAVFVEKRQQVESLLAENGMDRAQLAAAGEEMNAAEKALNELPKVKAMQESRAAFTQMMDNVNQILRLVITGETGEEDGCGGECGGECGGCCDSCGGCH